MKSGDDLIYILPKDRSPLLRIYDNADSLGLGCLRRDPLDVVGYDPAITSLSEDRRAETMMSRFVLLIGLMMLIGPLWTLEYLQSAAYNLAVIPGFVILHISWPPFMYHCCKAFQELTAAAA